MPAGVGAVRRKLLRAASDGDRRALDRRASDLPEGGRAPRQHRQRGGDAIRPRPPHVEVVRRQPQDLHWWVILI